jgi:hypothetical protein
VMSMTCPKTVVMDITPAEFERTTKVTYLGQVHGTMAALARMRPRGQGRIVNVGSALAFTGIPLQAPYCAAKFACRGFTESVRAELLAAGSPVTISLVHLPAVDTPQFDWCESKMDRPARPVAPVYRPEQAANAVADAVEDGRRSGVYGAWNRLIVAITSVAPGVVAHFSARTAIEGQQDAGLRRHPSASNLYEPVDELHDAGTSGRFGAEAHGVRSWQFMRTLPRTALDLMRSVLASMHDRTQPADGPGAERVSGRDEHAARPRRRGIDPARLEGQGEAVPRVDDGRSAGRSGG